MFGQFKMAMELPILFAAPFWVGMYWRRANRTAVWGTILFSLLVFFILPVAVPALSPGLRQHPSLATTTQVVTKTFERPATESDVARHEAWLAARDELVAKYEPLASAAEQPRYEAALAALGAEPPVASLGQPITIAMKSGGQSVFWRGGVKPVDAKQLELVRTEREGNVEVRVERIIGNQIGQGSLNLDFLLYSLVGIDLSERSKATLETLRLPARLLAPFLVLIVLSYLTPRGNDAALSRYFAKMNTPVLADACR